MPFVEITSVDLPLMMARIALLGPHMQLGVVQALDEEMKKVVAAAQPITPMDTGDLRKSIRVLGPSVEAGGNEITADIRAGGIIGETRGKPIEYALEVHERMNGHWTTPGTGPKYLEKPLLEEMTKFDANMAASIEKAVQSLTGPIVGMPTLPEGGIGEE